MKWKTQTGLVTSIEEMTDSHLANAYSYTKERSSFVTFEFLKIEIIKRIESEFYKQHIQCSFCSNIMQMTKFVEKVIEVGFCPDIIENRYKCQKCGATSNKRDLEIDVPAWVERNKL